LTVAENGDCRQIRRLSPFSAIIVAEIGDYSLQCGQAIRVRRLQEKAEAAKEKLGGDRQ